MFGVTKQYIDRPPVSILIDRNEDFFIQYVVTPVRT